MLMRGHINCRLPLIEAECSEMMGCRVENWDEIEQQSTAAAAAREPGGWGAAQTKAQTTRQQQKRASGLRATFVSEAADGSH